MKTAPVLGGLRWFETRPPASLACRPNLGTQHAQLPAKTSAGTRARFQERGGQGTTRSQALGGGNMGSAESDAEPYSREDERASGQNVLRAQARNHLVAGHQAHCE